LRSAGLRAGLRHKEGDFSWLTRHLFLSARAARLGNVPGYYRSSLAGLVHGEFEVVKVSKGLLGELHSRGELYHTSLDDFLRSRGRLRSTQSLRVREDGTSAKAQRRTTLFAAINGRSSTRAQCFQENSLMRRGDGSIVGVLRLLLSRDTLPRSRSGRQR
jgi:hypothetical protein